MPRGHITPTRLGILLAVAVGVLLGAVFGRPGAGQAASSVTKPVNTKLPTITGAPVVGQKVTATHGTWTQHPTSFSYGWNRCDPDGACAGIVNATRKTYTVRNADVGHTLRVTVTAHNSAGTGAVTSGPTATVPPSGCPVGTGAIEDNQLVPPAQLVIADATLSPSVKRSSRTIHIRVVIQACGGRPVQGATVFTTAIPYNQFTVAKGITAGDGSVVLTGARRAGFPASSHQRLLAVFVRATETGAPDLGGISSRRVLAFRFARH